MDTHTKVYQPPKLTSFARCKINNTIVSYQAIDTLEIPVVLKRKLEKRYINDIIYCSESRKRTLEDCVEFPHHFEQPFLNIGPDNYLTIMQWDWLAGIPHFAFERTHIINKWYEVRGDVGHFCNECIRDIREQIVLTQPDSCIDYIDLHTSCTSELADDLIDYLQCESYWCSKCTTTALFYIEDWPWYTHRDEPDTIQRTDQIGPYEQ